MSVEAHTIKFQLSLKSNLRWLADQLQIDRAVIYGIFANSSSILAGPVTIFMIVTHFSPELQGFYYTFNNMLALRVFVELGLGTVIISFASHEWSKLHLDKDGHIVGDSNALSRLVSLGRLAFIWYFIGGFIASIGLGVGGYLFFSQGKLVLGISWMSPWFFLCSLTVINMWLTPALFLLEGCNQVRLIYAYRMIQGICVNICTWIAILLGAGLWAAVVNAAVSIVCLVVFIFTKYRHFFKPMITYVTTSIIDWRTELWPMQWRIALGWMGGYFMSAFFTPLIFHYHGPVAAGQFGMTWALFLAVGSISNIWLARKRPQFGMLIAKKDYGSLDKLFFRSATVSIGIFGCGALTLWLIIYSVYAINHPLAVRVMSPLPAGLFLLGMFFTYFTAPFSYYLHAHNKEPNWGVSVSSAILVGLFAWILGKQFSTLGVSVAYVIVAIFFTFPCVMTVWYR